MMSGTRAQKRRKLGKIAAGRRCDDKGQAYAAATAAAMAKTTSCSMLPSPSKGRSESLGLANDGRFSALLLSSPSSSPLPQLGPQVGLESLSGPHLPADVVMDDDHEDDKHGDDVLENVSERLLIDAHDRVAEIILDDEDSEEDEDRYQDEDYQTCDEGDDHEEDEENEEGEDPECCFVRDLGPERWAISSTVLTIE